MAFPENPSIEQAIATIEHFSACTTTQEKTILLLKKNLNTSMHHSTDFFEEFKTSVELIKMYATHIAVLESGTPLEKALADKVKTAIDKYNTIVRERNGPSRKIDGFFAKLFHSEPKLFTEIPLGITKYTLFEEKQTASKISSLLSTDILGDKLSIRQYEKDIFLFKVMQLLQNDPLCTAFSKEELEEEVFTAPLSCAQIIEDTVKGTSVLVEQNVSVFPGETIKITGHFQRDLRQPNFVLFIKESMTSSVQSIQDGFPDTLQYMGCPLHETLFPLDLYKDAPKEIQEIFSKKKIVAQELLLNGKYNQKAKKLIHMKQELVHASMHTSIISLTKTIQAYCALDPSSLDLSKIHTFFMIAQKQKNPFSFIAKLHRKVAILFVQEMLFHIKKVWLFHKKSDIDELSFKKKLYEIERQVTEQHAKEIGAYMVHLGRILAKATKEIALLHMGIKKPLSLLALKTIQALFFQLEVFLEEITSEKNIATHIETSSLFEQKLFSLKEPPKTPLLIAVTEWHSFL